MDPLSSVLALLWPQSFITAGFDAGGTWSVRFAGHAGRIKCYALMRGECWLMVDGVADRIRLHAGDCFVLPGGHGFVLASDPDVTALSARDVFAGAHYGGIVVHQGGGEVFLTGSRFDVDARRAGALLDSLPTLIYIEGAGEQAVLRWLIERMMAEARGQQAGASLAANHLAQLMLLQALRIYLSTQKPAGVGWFFALADPHLSVALGAMHGEPGRRWTLEALARLAGMSRSVFAQQFREKVGMTPIAYLTRWRMVLAAERLTLGQASMAETATSLGYESENAFNTAFKRVMGCSPRRYGRSQAASA
ncbi:AraC family transcriptional regulator [Paraburkholderia sp. J76]|uniref:AraC family transcriptional regulator n=1 Tax=Paraburkholderia sp. J76 TaxID=2805439 RepID=UPI002ABE338B|nr:AraC family transcriptional regulator [Paraburkholderia sp. J76]